MLNRYIIERNMKGVGTSSDEDFAKMASRSNNVLDNLGSKIQWLKSYITDDKVYCEYLADNEDVVREHAKQGGFPADKISKVIHICDPTTATDDFAELRSSNSPENVNVMNS